MNVTVNSQDLAAELRRLNKIVPTKASIPILSHALMTADEGGITFYATDLELSLSGACRGRVEESGIVAFPVAKLLAMVEQFPDSDVILTANDVVFAVRCGKFSSRLQAMPTEDFPTPPEINGTTVLIDAADLRNLIDKTRHAISDTKHILKGALLSFVDASVAMVATDGQRLALATAARAGIDVDVIIPTKTLDVLASGSDSCDIEVTVGDRHLFFAFNGRLLTSRKLEGRFPSYDRIIPRSNEKKITIDRNAWVASLRRVLLTAEETEAVFIAFEADQMTMSSKSAGIGASTETLDVGYEGAAMQICAKGTYLLDFLAAATSPAMTLALGDTNGHALLESGDHLGVIALMKT